MDLKDLYRDVILDHNKRPRNFGVLAVPPAYEARGANPLCGDTLRVWVQLEADRVADVKFEGKGCAISVASASLMTEIVRGQSEAEAEQLFETFHRITTGKYDKISLKILEKLCRALNCTPNDIYRFTPDNELDKSEHLSLNKIAHTDSTYLNSSQLFNLPIEKLNEIAALINNQK